MQIVILADGVKTVYKKASDEISAANTRKIMGSKYGRSFPTFTFRMAVISAFIGIYLRNVIDAAVSEPEYDKTVNLNPYYRGVNNIKMSCNKEVNSDH